MQRSYTETVSNKGKVSSSNFDFSFGRMKTDKLSEQMSVEKANAILKVPSTRSTQSEYQNAILNHCFRMAIDSRVKISGADPAYEQLIENRHVMDCK